MTAIAYLYRIKKIISLFVILFSIMLCCPTSFAVAGDEPLYDSMMTIYRTRDYDSAIVFANRALKTLDNSGQAFSKQSARIQHRIASCYQQKGDRAQAIRGYERAVTMWRALTIKDPLGLAASLGNLGRLFGELGQFSKSEVVLIEALELKENNLPDTAFSLARTCQKVGDFYRMTGDFKKAEEYLLKAHKIYSSGSSKRRINMLFNLNSLATVYHLQNRFEDAAKAYEEVIDGLQNMDFPNKWSELIGIVGNLATLRGGQRDFDEAISLFNYGLSVIDSLNMDLPERRAQFKGYLGETFFYMNRYSEAEENMLLALEILDSLYRPGNPKILERQNTLADIYTATKRYTEADSIYALVLETRLDVLGNRHPDVGQTYLAWSRLKEKLGLIDSAFVLANKSFSIHQRNFFEGVQVLSEQDALSYAQDMRVSGLQVISLGLRMSPLLDAALSTLSTIKGAVTDQLIYRNKSLRNIEDEAIRKLTKKHKAIRAKLVEIAIKPPSGLDNSQVQSKIDSLTIVAEGYESELTRIGDNSGAFESSGEVDVDSIFAAIPSNTCLIEFLRADNIWDKKVGDYTEQFLVMVIGHSGERSFVSLGSASIIDSVVSSYRSHFIDVASRQHYPSKSDALAYDSIESPLYDLIWQPLESLIENYETVIIAPDGALNLVSFAGLKNNDGKYLIEEKTIEYVGTGRDLLRVKTTEDKADGLLAFGDPDYNATALERKATIGKRETRTTRSHESGKSYLKAVANDCFDLSSISVRPLPMSGTEVKAVSKTWQDNPSLGPSQVFYQSSASEENFKRFAGGQSVIHLSTHGYYLRAECGKSEKDNESSIDPYAKRQNPLIYSGLLLAGSNLHGDGADEAGVEDGILTAEEISQTNLDGVNTVVLSACETALGDIRNNEGVYGLRRAFQMAGAATVVSALWKIPAEETAVFFGELYKNSNESLPNRLRQLQLAQIKKFRAAGFADHPFVWGAFVAIGHGN